MKKAKKFLLNLLAFASVSAFTLGMIACELSESVLNTGNGTNTEQGNGGTGLHACVFKEEVIADEYLQYAANCTGAAVYYKSCECGAKGAETFEYGKALEHVFDQEVIADDYLQSVANCTGAAVYYKSCECGAKGAETFAYGDFRHVDNNDGTCSICSTKYYSAGLEYKISEDATYYIVAGLGECTDTDLIIPSKYDNLPVAMIGDGAFRNDDNLISATIPNSVSTIGYSAFEYCDGLISITIPSSVKGIRSRAFGACSNLTSVYYTGDMVGWCAIDFVDGASNPLGNGVGFYINNAKVVNLIIPDGVETIKDHMFENCDGLESVTIRDSVTTIGEGAFYGCGGLTSVTIGNSVTTIGKRAFAWCDLTSITIPDSVTTIGIYTFEGCYNLTSITFTGTVEEWKAIEKGKYWNDTVPATKVVCSDGEVAL